MPKLKSVSDFVIDKDVPIPSSWNAKYPFGELLIGDSFYTGAATRKTTSTIRSAAAVFGRRHNMKFITRAEGRGLRIWRVE